MTMNRSAFYDAIRPMFGGKLRKGQVHGMDTILNEWEASGLTDQRWLAYILATVFLETDRTMQPINEYGGNAYFNGRYGPQTKVGKQLGNTEPGDGARFHGRGYVQLTGRSNYTRASKELGVDFVGNPSFALDADYASQIMFRGMEAGWFTTRKLADYFNEKKTDWKNARRIINGLDRASEIAGYAERFNAAITEARSAPDLVQPVPPPPEPPEIPERPPARPLWRLWPILLIAAAFVAAFFMLT